MTMASRALLVEHSKDDALSLLRELRRGGYQPAWQRASAPRVPAQVRSQEG